MAAVAALIAFGYVADPGVGQLWPLLAVTVAGPYLLPRIVAAPFRLLRWWWRKRHPEHQPRHLAPDEEPALTSAQPDQPA